MSFYFVCPRSNLDSGRTNLTVRCIHTTKFALYLEVEGFYYDYKTKC